MRLLALYSCSITVHLHIVYLPVKKLLITGHTELKITLMIFPSLSASFKVLLASCYIPFYAGLSFPRFRGQVGYFGLSISLHYFYFNPLTPKI